MLTFSSRIAAHHQNTLAKWSIQTIMYIAWTFMVHVSLHWSEYGAVNLALQEFAVNHYVWFHDHLSNHSTCLMPLELLTQTEANQCDFLWTHIWGCPVYVLDPKHQDGQMIPKGGWFLGFTCGQCLPPFYWICTQQYHLVFDDVFEILFSTGNDSLLDDICNHLLDSNRNFLLYDNKFNSDDPLVYHPPTLDLVWLREPKHHTCLHNLEECHGLAEDWA